jgi:transposase
MFRAVLTNPAAVVFGLTPRARSSAKMQQVGRTAKCGEAMVGAPLYGAANVMVTGRPADHGLRSWARGRARRRGARKAKAALARRLSAAPHRMGVDDATDVSRERPAPTAA